ncbi:MAG: CRP-like cAMP-binding protein [Bacteroidia bacterium]|jgi:CRP-like cAMP-binding protein
MDVKPSNFFGNSDQLTEEEANIINECIEVRTFPKGTILLSEGQVCREGYYNVKGLVRSYQLVKGEERTTEFYEEYSSIISLSSYLNNTLANHYFECLEETTLTVITKKKEAELLKRYPPYADLCRLGMEAEFGAAQERSATFMTSTAEERYLKLLKERPTLSQRVPQYQLASFLGIKPESLSRIRKRIAVKP